MCDSEGYLESPCTLNLKL